MAGQQLGRTRNRERAGSTGRAGDTRVGNRLAVLFFIDRFLNSIRHFKYEAKVITQREEIREERGALANK